jgi:hypothetical protein
MVPCYAKTMIMVAGYAKTVSDEAEHGTVRDRSCRNRGGDLPAGRETSAAGSSLFALRLMRVSPTSAGEDACGPPAAQALG